MTRRRKRPRRSQGRSDRPAINLEHKRYEISRLIKEGRWAEALVALEEYRAYDPDSEFVLTNVGTCYDMLGEFERAAEWFAQALDKQPGNADLVWGLALSQANAGHLEAAIASFERFSQLDPGRAQAFRVDLTVQGLRKILRGELGPHHYQIDTMMKRAFHYADMGEWETALAWVDRVLDLAPDDAEVLYNRARILQEVDEDAAIPVYERAADLSEHDGRPAYNLGNIYWKRGERERAISAYERAIATDPAFPSPYHNLGTIYEEMGEMEHAIELWHQVLALDPSHQNARIALRRAGVAVETEPDRREAARDRRRAALAEQVRQLRRTAPQAQVYENDYARLTISSRGVAFESLQDELNCALISGPTHYTWLSDEEIADWLREIRAWLREVHWTNTREILVYVQYDEWDTYTFYKRFEDGDERDAVVEGTLDVGRVPAWGKVRADSDLRLGVVSGKPRLRGLILFLRLDDRRNLLVLGLSEHEVVETLA
jgi:tetratricopeptide (TPR) repeat protein